VAYQETTFRTKINGGLGLGEHLKNLLISATIEASNFKFGTQVGFGEWHTKKQHLGPKLAGVGSRGASEKFWDPLLISATTEADIFKFGTQLRFDK